MRRNWYRDTLDAWAEDKLSKIDRPNPGDAQTDILRFTIEIFVYFYMVTNSYGCLCIYCRAFKFKNKAPGMCYAGRKVKLPELHSPPEPLSMLIDLT